MKYRQLGQGLTVSAIGLGCMGMLKGGNFNYGGDADLDEAVRTGRIVTGDYVLFVAFGAGLTWASALIRWS